MKLNIPYNQIASKDEAYNKVKENLTPEFFQKFNVKADLDFSTDYQMKASGKGFDLSMIFHDTEVEVNIKLGLLFKAFTKQVGGIVEKQLKRVI